MVTKAARRIDAQVSIDRGQQVLGRGAERAYERLADAPRHDRGLRWLTRFGPKACLLAWVPVVGDPLCAVAGWLRLPFWPCLAYMAVGKFLRYASLTAFAAWL